MLPTIVLITAQLFLTDAMDAARNPGERRQRTGARRAAPTQDHELRIFKIMHGDCMELTAALQQVMRHGSITPHPSSNSIIIAAPEKDLKAVTTLIQQLDNPIESAKYEKDLTVVPTTHRQADALASLLPSIFGSKGIFGEKEMKIATDRGRSSIILSGPRESVSKAQSVIKLLDTPVAMVNLEFIFFRARLHVGGPAPEIPDDLRDVADGLKRFGRIEFLGRLSTVAVEEEEFKVGGKIANFITADTRGRLLSGSKEGTIKLVFEAEMNVQRQRPALKDSEANTVRRPPTSSQFLIETTVVTQRGDYVVLGSAPNGWESGESAILVLHARS